MKETKCIIQPKQMTTKHITLINSEELHFGGSHLKIKIYRGHLVIKLRARAENSQKLIPTN